MKGVAAPVRVHRLGGIGSLRTRLDVSRARGFSRFVGRGDEMHVLESALARARDGNAQVVGIVGDAGQCIEACERIARRAGGGPAGGPRDLQASADAGTS